MSITMEHYNQIADHLYKKCSEGEISVNQREHLLTKAKSEIDGSHLFNGGKFFTESTNYTHEDYMKEKDRIYREWSEGAITLFEREQLLSEAQNKYIETSIKINSLKTMMEKALLKEELDDGTWFMADVNFHGAKVYLRGIKDTESKEYKRFLSDYNILNRNFGELKTAVNKMRGIKSIFNPSSPIQLTYSINVDGFAYITIDFKPDVSLLIKVVDGELEVYRVK